MLTGCFDDFIRESKVQDCCCCFRHREGIMILGGLQILLSLFILFIGIVWTQSLRSNNSCYSMMYVPPGADCFPNINKLNADEFHQELISISNYLNPFKPRYSMWMFLFISHQGFSIVSSIFLVLGANKQKKVFLIPWLILNKLFIVYSFFGVFFLIFLEGRLFEVSTTVFGLFTIPLIVIGCILLYFVYIVTALYIQLEDDDLEIEKAIGQQQQKQYSKKLKKKSNYAQSNLAYQQDNEDFFEKYAKDYNKTKDDYEIIIMDTLSKRRSQIPLPGSQLTVQPLVVESQPL